MEETGITIEKTEHLKGIALILLLWHHLFGFQEYLLLESSIWTSVSPAIDMIIGTAAKICISIFLFCSGYGMYKSYFTKDRKHYVIYKMLKTLIPYWTVMALTVIYLMAAGKFELKYLFVNLFALIHDDNIMYVSFSWFIKLYLCLLLSLPLLKLIETKWKKNIFIDVLLYILLPTVLGIAMQKYQTEEEYHNIGSFLISSVLFTVSWFPLFAMGFVFAKYKIYEMIRSWADRLPGYLIISLSLLVACNAIYWRYMYSYRCYTDIIYGPFFIVSCLLLLDRLKIKSKIVIPYLGKRSIYYWLLSGLFFLNTSELQHIIFLPRYSLLILIWTIVILTPPVFLCDWISTKLLSLFQRKQN